MIKNDVMYCKGADFQLLHSLGQCKARPLKFHTVCLFFIFYFLFFISVLQRIMVLAL